MNEALMKNYEKTLKEKVTVIHSGFGETPKAVAFVYVDKKLSENEKCEVAFMKTNSIDNAWWENENVECLITDNRRSTSSGDFVLTNEGKYKCAPVGWEKV